MRRSNRERLAREKSNTQADVVVTLPPFIQQAQRKGLLTPYRPGGVDKVAAADVTATDPNAAGLKKLMAGVDVFTPDWTDINDNLDTYVDAWRSATGSS